MSSFFQNISHNLISRSLKYPKEENKQASHLAQLTQPAAHPHLENCNNHSLIWKHRQVSHLRCAWKSKDLCLCPGMGRRKSMPVLTNSLTTALTSYWLLSPSRQVNTAKPRGGNILLATPGLELKSFAGAKLNQQLSLSYMLATMQTFALSEPGGSQLHTLCTSCRGAALFVSSGSVCTPVLVLAGG